MSKNLIPEKNLEFVLLWKKNLRQISQKLFGQLSENESLALTFNAEDTTYIRINAAKVRQNTEVQQITLTANLQFDKKSSNRSWTLGGNLENDLAKSIQNLNSLRDECRSLPDDLHASEIVNNGQNEEDFTSETLNENQILNQVLKSAEDLQLDLAGLFLQGPTIRASVNSKGQWLWFSTKKFCIDYSLFNGPKAVKGIYCKANWNCEDWILNLQKSLEQLRLLDKPMIHLKPGSYRVFLQPMAVAEILNLLSYDFFSMTAYKNGRSSSKKLVEGTANLAPTFHLYENFDLGLSPKFNSFGEISKNKVSLIRQGRLDSMLISSRSAKEYNLQGNFASEYESLRSPEIAPGKLSQQNILQQLDTGLYISNLHYLNWSDRLNARITGMTRYACYWVENGRIQGPIQDMRFDISLYEAFGANLEDLTDFQQLLPELSTYYERAVGGCKLPGLLLRDFKFTL